MAQVIGNFDNFFFFGYSVNTLAKEESHGFYYESPG